MYENNFQPERDVVLSPHLKEEKQMKLLKKTLLIIFTLTLTIAPVQKAQAVVGLGLGAVTVMTVGGVTAASGVLPEPLEQNQMEISLLALFCS